MDKLNFLMSRILGTFCRLPQLEQKGVDVTVVEKDSNKVLQKMLTVRPQVVLLDVLCGLDALAVSGATMPPGGSFTSFFVTGAFQSEEMVWSCWTRLCLLLCQTL